MTDITPGTTAPGTTAGTTPGTSADLPEIRLADPDLLRDPFTAYGRVREQSPLASIEVPGIGRVLALLRHADAQAMLRDPRFGIASHSFLRPDVPEDCLPYLQTMTEREPADHARQRRLVAPAFSARRMAGFRPRIEPIVDALLDDVARAEEAGDGADGADGVVDLREHLATPLPMDVICEVVGIAEAARPAWRRYGAAIAAAAGPEFAAAVPGIIADAREAVARRRVEPGDDLISDLVRRRADDGDRLSETELVTLVWHLVLAGQTPTNLVVNAIAALLSDPEQLAVVRAEGRVGQDAVEELIRWCGPILLTIPRYAREDAELCGVAVRQHEPVMAVVAAANRDPRAFEEPECLDLRRTSGRALHLGFGNGPHFCLGASLARVQVEVVLTALFRRFPDLALAEPVEALRAPDPGTWRLTRLPVRLRPRP